MLQYILESIAFQLVFLIIYDLFLKRETFFQWNRLYLIGTYIISMVLPWIKIEAMKTTVPEAFQAYPEFLWNSNDMAITATAVEETGFAISWEYVLLFGGMLLATLFFGYKLYQIFTLRHKGEVHYFKDFTQIIVSNSSIAFSFFKSIFLGDKVIEKEHQSIVAHELVHIRQRHSYDLMFFELMRIVGWFNPLVYIYQRRVSELHEFIADSKVAKTNKKEQYEFLLSQVFQTQNISFINQFFKSSLIKKRIVMLTKEKSKQVLKLKYLLLVPLVFGMLAYTSAENESIAIEESNEVQTKEDEELISEVKEEIEDAIENLIAGDETLFKNGNFDNLEKRQKVIFHMKLINREQEKSEIILSKKEYFKNEIITKMFFQELERGMKKKNNSINVFAIKTPLPSTERYECYVGRKEAFFILDTNLQFSIKAYEQQVVLIEAKSSYANSSFLFEVENVKDLTGEELRKFNHSLDEVFGNKSTYKDLILTDGLYTFRIFGGLPQMNQDILATSNFKGYVEKSGTKVTLNVYDFKDLTAAEKAQRESLSDEVRNSPKIDTLIVTDGKYGSSLTSNPSGGFKYKLQGDINPVPFAMVEEVPIFPGCEDVDDKRKCFQESMQKHISKNFNYPQEAQDRGIQGRVSTLFIISKKGKIAGLRMRGPDSILEKEVARIIGRLPKMKAGKHKGKKVDVPFSIPITFRLNKQSDEIQLMSPDSENLNENQLSTVKQYNQLVQERKRLLKNSNEKNPIIVNLDEQLRRLRGSLNGSLQTSPNTNESSLSGGIKQMLKNKTIIQYNQLVAERQRLLKSSNEKNPIIVNLDKQIKSLEEAIDQESEMVPFATVDEIPVFPGCEDEENRRVCFNKMMQKHISKNFNYPLEAQEKGIQGRVSIMFTIGKDGSIQKVRMRGPDPLLEKEAARIIGLLPKMVPGKQKGKVVNVPFSIPISFKLGNESIKFDELEISPDKPTPLVIIDGKESSVSVLSSIEKNEIASMLVFKDVNAISKYGERGKNGVIVVITENYEDIGELRKKIANTPDSLILLDGKEISREEMEKLDTDEIESMNVVIGKVAEKEYGEKGRNGVIELKTKKKE